DALRSGTSGEVQVEFTVGVDGTVTAARVVQATPPRVFDREALNADRRRHRLEAPAPDRVERPDVAGGEHRLQHPAAGGPRLARPAEDPDAHEVVEGSPEDAVARVVVGAFAQDDLQMFRARHQQRPDDAEVETDYFPVRRPADAFELLQGVPDETRQGPI